MNYDKLLDMTADLGYQLMSSGAEIYRVEESMSRLLCAYGMEHPEVFAIPTCIIVSLAAPDGHSITRMRRVPAHGTDVERLEQCNTLCRRLCSQPPPLDEAWALVDNLSKQAAPANPWLVLTGYGLAPMFFSPLLGGSIRDAQASFVAGMVVGSCILYGRKVLGPNAFFRTAVCAAAASLLSQFMVWLGLGDSVDFVTISVLMVMVPGLAITNAMREIMAGDTISGLTRTADAILSGGAIALGAAAGMLIGHAF